MDPRLDTGGWLTLTGESLDSSLPAGIFTLQDAPGFAQRDNAKLSGPSVAATTRPKSTQNRRGDTGVRWSVVLARNFVYYISFLACGSFYYILAQEFI